MRGPSALLAARTARIMQQGAARARTARASRAAPAGVGDRGGVRGTRQVDGGWRGLVPRTGGPHHPPIGRRSCRGSGGPTQGPSAPPVRVGGGGGGGCGLVGGCARQGDGGAVSSAAERHRAADRAEERPGLAKVGRGSRGARGVGGAAVSGGARTPLGGDECRRASSTGANPG